MTLILVGLNHKTAPVELREQFSFTGGMLPMALGELQALSRQEDNTAWDCDIGALNELVILSTCNRLEIYAVTPANANAGWCAIEIYLARLQGISVEALRTYLYCMEQDAAIEHLMTVACGLDSQILGEPQILGQVAQAFNDAHAAGAVGPILSHLFAQAIHAGKRARSETDISRHTTSISHAATLLAREQIGDLSRIHALIVGAGEMADLAAQALKQHGTQDIACINRTYKHAEELAARNDLRAMNWSHLSDALVWADVVISATGAPHIVIYTDDVRQVLLQRDGRSLVLIDIAVPRDIEESVSDLTGIQYYDIDDIEMRVDANLAQRQAAVPSVQNIVRSEVASFMEWLQCRQVMPVISDLRHKAQALADTEVEHTLRQLPELSEREREIIIRLGHRIVNKLLHDPTVQLKAQAANGNGYGYAYAVRELFTLNEGTRPSDRGAKIELSTSCDLRCLLPGEIQ